MSFASDPEFTNITVSSSGGQRRDQPFRQLDDVLVEVARVRVERGGLRGDGRHDPRVGVPDDRHVVVRVEVAPPVGGLHPRALCRGRGGAASGSSVPRARCPSTPRRRASSSSVGTRRAIGVRPIDARRRAASSKPMPSSCSSSSHAGSAQPWMYALSGYCRRPDGADEDRLGHATSQEVGEEIGLERFERRDRCVPCEEGLAHLEHVGPAADERLQGGRHVEDERGVGHVAEVDDPGHPAAIVEEQVVERDVVVDDLRPEAGERRHDARLRSGR